MSRPGGGAVTREAPVLVTGATGYVGGRLVPRLLEAGYRVRCVARSAPKLVARPWASDPRVEIVEADLADADATATALRGCPAAYYLVHSSRGPGAGGAGQVETGWSDAGPIPGDPDWAGGTVFTDRRQTEVAASAADTFAAVARLGGDTGWYGADWLWRLRGSLDHLAGGPGLRRGRRDAERVAYGDVTTTAASLSVSCLHPLETQSRGSILTRPNK